jgi:hypothetical protein
MGEVMDGATTGMMTDAVGDKLNNPTGGMSLISMIGRIAVPPGQTLDERPMPSNAHGHARPPTEDEIPERHAKGARKAN